MPCVHVGARFNGRHQVGPRHGILLFAAKVSAETPAAIRGNTDALSAPQNSRQSNTEAHKARSAAMSSPPDVDMLP
jgi:hypothetical protein